MRKLLNKIRSEIEADKSNLIILRGFPGSGKSTLGLEIYNQFGIQYIEPDSFITKGSLYNYYGDNYDDALIRCKKFILDNLGFMDICIGDVFPTKYELNDLISLAIQCYSNYIIIDLPKISFKESYLRNIHSVNKDDLIRMYEKWEDYD